MHHKRRGFWLALLLCLPGFSYALPDDRNQPISVSADRASINERTGVTVYTGRVEIQQGSMLIKGARVELHRNDAGVERIISTGSPAEFQQRPQADAPLTRAYGKRMDYRVTQQEVTITESARVDQGQDTFTGERIVYNMDKAIVNAFGSNSEDGERVRMVIQPRTDSN
ncbi:lipopolysaccharide transport periplasmic protein LptA [Marinobacterium sp. AK62]|uniref:Lipopolysaccharide export system protein LptA n=1 Tax=Marinobacterium alkalitolerans TaxID=1542925 RepID=A0ABS3ZCP3_9GAMM|nr:lipopolysaccharide transport periplasmic protein LptA [Marinobacterium alkalitolerans]MBP0048794.1 lipopolysaccharide transport periplasmic protein LptA [Marinobacterium alkalitolerans]